jgi:hypothetical protein
MPHIKETTVFKFDELSDRAKERARDKYRESALDYEWWEFVYDDAATCLGILGIDVMQASARLMDGTTRAKPAIYFSGFSSQGDGACFDCRYDYAKGAPKAIKAHAPQDAELLRIANELQDVQRRNFYRLTATSKHSGRYSSETSTTIEVYLGDDDAPKETYETAAELLRDAMRWVYRQLEQEYDYQMSAEQIDESLRANDYDFDEDGSLV